MHTQDTPYLWADFQTTNRTRRAIRDFGNIPIPDDIITALLTEAGYAPSSGNLQPYQLHWIKTPELKSQVAEACNGQKRQNHQQLLLLLSPALKLAEIRQINNFPILKTHPNYNQNQKIIIASK